MARKCLCIGVIAGVLLLIIISVVLPIVLSTKQDVHNDPTDPPINYKFASQ